MEITAFYLGIIFNLPLSSSVPPTLGRGIVLSALSLSIHTRRSMCWSKRISSYSAGRGGIAPPTLFATSTGIVGTSALGGRAIRHHHILAPQIAASDTAPPFSQTGASVCPSWQPDSHVRLTSTLRLGGVLSPVDVDLASLFPGSWLSGSHSAGRRVSSFCTAASRSPGLGTSLRLTIP